MKGHLYFVGIVGHAMRGLALAATGLGFKVTGFDPGAQNGPATDWLAEHGLAWSKTFHAADLDQVTAVIITGAHVTSDAPVIVEARRRHIPVKSYAQLFGELTAGARLITVAGTHGKTTTTAMIAWLLQDAGARPDYLVGVKPGNFDSSVRLDHGKIVIAEGDEYRASPLEDKSKVQYYHPDVVVLTSVEHDHPDIFPDLAAVVARFKEIVMALSTKGRLIACAESPVVQQIAGSAKCQVETYGLTHADFTARDLVFHETGIEFDVLSDGKVLGRLAVGLYGKHNVLNALASAATVLGEGYSFQQIMHGMSSFKGTYRRFNVVSKPGTPITVVDDYAHHPTEVATNIEAARLHFPGRRIVAVFRPHTFSRTAALLAEFQEALDTADLVYVTDIEGARETDNQPHVSGNDIVQALKTPALYVPSRTELVAKIAADAKVGDVILCFSVSGYDQLAEELSTRLDHS